MEEMRRTERLRPDILLKKVNRESRGKLTVFLGAAAGVGKTFAMLKAAHEKLQEGKNIVIGWVESHGREETERLVAGLPRVTPRQFPYRGRVLAEMDIDAIFAQRPEIVLIDELAHTNVPGSRHVRRYQDVEEVLAAGIDVYTTVNIQHVESLNDIVAQITGVVVRETVPDYVLEMADRLQLIDLAAEDLLQRLKDGKIYLPEQAKKALKNFFRQGNVNALRELSLRFTAKHVDQTLAEYMEEHAIAGPWPVSGKVMVCISGSPFAAHLLRAANRLSSGLRSELLAVHIETEDTKYPTGDAEAERIARNMKLAEELGAKTLTVVGNDLVEEVLNIARQQNVTAIVVGKPVRSRLTDFFRGAVVDKIIRRSGDINVYVIHAEAEMHSAEKPIRQVVAKTVPWPQLAGALALVSLVTAIGWQFQQELQVINIAFLYVLPVLLSAVWWGRWPSYISAVAGILALDFYFIEPVLTFSIEDVRYIWSLLIFLVLSGIIGGRTEKLRQEMRRAQQRERSVRSVYEFSREIAAVGDSDYIAATLAKQASETVGKRVRVILGDKEQGLREVFQYDPSAAEQQSRFPAGELDRAEAAVAAWVYKNKEGAGCGTETLAGAEYQYMPIGGAENIYAVFGVCLDGHRLPPAEQRLVDAWVRLAAVAMERAGLAEQARQAKLFLEADKLRNALFNSISHELKTPLAAILGSTASLLEGDSLYDAQDRRELLLNVQESSLRMERLIANLLDTARLESGMLNIKEDWCDMEEIVGSVLQRGAAFLREHQLKTEIESDLPFIKADCVLLEQVLFNLLDNAAKYSPKNSEIKVRIKKQAEEIEVAVLDRGMGIPADEIDRVFDKFYRGRHLQKISGTGLGLSICKGIIDAHQGMFAVKSRPGGGTVFSFRLPLGPERMRKKEILSE